MPDEQPSLLYVATVAPTVQHFLSPYATHFRALGWRVDVAASQTGENQGLRDVFDNVYEVPLSRSLFDLPGIARSERSVERLLLRTRPSIVHVHTPIAGFVTRLAARRISAELRPGVIYTAHGFHFHSQGHPATNALFLAAELLAGRWTDRLIVINDEDEAAARRHRIVDVSRLLRLPGIGIDLGMYSRSAVSAGDTAAAKTDLRFAAGAPLFVVIGELNPNKRPDDVLAALTAMRHTEATLVFVGEGPQRGRLESEVRAARIGDRVRFVGFIPDVRPLLGAATALVLASRREGLPRSIMEALAFGIPVVASDARGNRELVGDDGFIVPIGDVEGLSRAMDRILDDPARTNTMRRRGRSRMLAGYDLRVLIQRHEAIYRSLLEERMARH